MIDLHLSQILILDRMGDHSEMSSSDTESTPRMGERKVDTQTNGELLFHL